MALQHTINEVTMSHKKFSLPKKRQELPPITPPIPCSVQQYEDIKETYERVILHKK